MWVIYAYGMAVAYDKGDYHGLDIVSTHVWFDGPHDSIWIVPGTLDC